MLDIKCPSWAMLSGSSVVAMAPRQRRKFLWPTRDSRSVPKFSRWHGRGVSQGRHTQGLCRVTQLHTFLDLAICQTRLHRVSQMVPDFEHRLIEGIGHLLSEAESSNPNRPVPRLFHSAQVTRLPRQHRHQVVPPNCKFVSPHRRLPLVRRIPERMKHPMIWTLCTAALLAIGCGNSDAPVIQRQNLPLRKPPRPLKSNRTARCGGVQMEKRCQ